MADFKKYTEVLATLTDAQVAEEVAARLREFNQAEDRLLAKVHDGVQPSIDDWMVIDECRTFHRLAERERAKRREVRA